MGDFKCLDYVGVLKFPHALTGYSVTWFDYQLSGCPDFTSRYFGTVTKCMDHVGVLKCPEQVVVMDKLGPTNSDYQGVLIIKASRRPDFPGQFMY